MPKQLSAIEYAWNQSGRLRAERDDARGENKRLRRDLENMRYHNELKADQIDRQADEIRNLRSRLNQLRGTVRAQGEQIQGPRGDSSRSDSNASSWAQQENPSIAFQTGPPPTPVHREKTSPAPSTPHAPEQVRAVQTRYPSAIEVIEAERRKSAARHSTNPANQPHTSLAQSYQKRDRMPSQGNDLSYSYEQEHPSSHSHQRDSSMQFDESVGLSERFTYHSSRTMRLPYRSAPTSPYYPVDSMQPPIAPSNAMGLRPGPIVLREESPTTDWQTELSKFFWSVEEWTRRYANVPIQANVGESLMQVLSKFSEPDLIGTLLNNTDNRYFLVARLINSWITSDLFKPAAFRSFSEAADDRVNDLLHQIQHDTAIETHHALREEIAAVGKEITQKAGFDPYIDREVNMRSSALWDRVAPLVPREYADIAWDQLSNIYREGFRLSALMISTPLVFTLQFPLADDRELFNLATMLNRDPSFLGDPKSLQKQRLRIRLGITPVVFTTSYSNKTVDTAAVHKANVLLMY